jgi:hypothetical protein
VARQSWEAIMSELLSKFDSGEIIGFAAVVGTFLCGLICGPLGIMLGFYAEAQKTRRAEAACALKQDMLNRGMSADEIRTVLDAGATGAVRAACRRHACSA